MKKTQLVIVGFEDGGKKLGAKENGYTLEAGKVWGKKEKKGKKKKEDSPLEPSERNATMQTLRI